MILQLNYCLYVVAIRLDRTFLYRGCLQARRCSPSRTDVSKRRYSLRTVLYFEREHLYRQCPTSMVHSSLAPSQPDLVKRLRDNLPLTPYNRDTFYTKGPQAIEGSLEGFRSEQAHADTPADSTGYTDYESYSKQQSFSDLKDIHNLVQALATTVSA